MQILGLLPYFYSFFILKKGLLLATKTCIPGWIFEKRMNFLMVK